MNMLYIYIYLDITFFSPSSFHNILSLMTLYHITLYCASNKKNRKDKEKEKLK